ncbi:NAD(P)-dependent oxidoreductase [Luedemannella flava]|uniref:NAD(P)-dependent oxidoreductase n=1 Tax=Luedemannella flava TaxID=349316 RepID=A0ABN2LUG3_9ACTN
MKIIVTGNEGYIGSVLTDGLIKRGHTVAGFDNGWFSKCVAQIVRDPPMTIRKDLRDVVSKDLAGAQAVIHLAALSNEQFGCWNSHITNAINVAGTLRLSQAAADAGVEHLVFVSSTAVYGRRGAELVDETVSPQPATVYSRSKLDAERAILAASPRTMRTTILRPASVFGFSPRFRMDLAVNEFVTTAVTSGIVEMRSEGTAWRPFVHIDDLCLALIAVVEAPDARDRQRVFNVGLSQENYQIADVAVMVNSVLNVEVRKIPTRDQDVIGQRVSFDRFREQFPAWQPVWTLPEALSSVAYEVERAAIPLKRDPSMFRRLDSVKKLQNSGFLDADLKEIHRPSS